MAVPDQGWYYLDAEQQSQGPFPLSYLQALNQSGYFKSGDALFWRDGQGEWKPLKELAELHAALQQPPPAADGSSSGAAAAVGSGPPPAPRRGARAAAAPAVPADPKLAGFLSEISALEAGEEAGAAAGNEGDAPASPPPNERRFEDDDGTWYVWDSSLRKFMPEGELAAGTAGAAAGAAGTAGTAGAAGAAGAAYNEEDMVYVPDEEKQPEYQPPPKYADLPDDEDEDGPAGKAPAGKAPAGKAPAGKAPAGKAPAGKAPAGKAARPQGGDAQPAAAEQQGGEGGTAGDKRDAQAAALEAAQEKAKKAKEAKQAGWFELKINTNVYVTGLPEDVTEAEMVETFSKCGVIKEDLEGRPRIKIYRDKETGRPKGDGLVTYLKEPSVDLALQILDGTPLRYGLPNMSVTKAKFEQKGEQFVERRTNKKAAKKKLEKLEKRALGWGGFDDALKPQQITVILRNMFSPEEFVENPGYKEELEGDIKSECAKLGRVDKLRVFHGHPQGVVSVKFTTLEAADECVRIMNGRFFGGRQLEASKWDGFTNFNVKVLETEEEQQARLERFAAELEAGGAAGAEPAEQ